MLKVHYALRTQENTRCEFHWECTWKTGRKLFVIWIQLTSIHGAFWKLGRNVTSLIYTMMCVIQVNNDETSQMYFPSDTICSAEQERTIFQVTYSVLMRKVLNYFAFIHWFVKFVYANSTVKDLIFVRNDHKYISHMYKIDPSAYCFKGG